ncbi:MAG: class I SAM-dependent methyltransferase [Pseudomonadota bacterium]
MFNDPSHAAEYADRPAQFMPGYHDVHRMVGVLIGECSSDEANVLVHGAGGGLELEAFAKSNPGWTFTGVEPAKPMLDEAAKRLGPLTERIVLHHGYIDDAPEGPFDAATSLLTLHFLDPKSRQDTVTNIVRRLKPGAPFIAVHCSFPQSPEHRDTWLLRHRACAIAGGADPDLAEQGRAAIEQSLPILDPHDDLGILTGAGLVNVTEFYAAFTWRGWVGYAP